MENELKVVVVKPEQYPEVALVENVEEWFKGEKNGLVLNRGLFEAGCTQMLQIVAGVFFVCGVSEDGSFRSLTDREVYLYLERFRQPEKFLTAENVIFCVPFTRGMGYASDLPKKHLGD